VTDAKRMAAIDAFLGANGWTGVEPALLAADASFRRYYRLAGGSWHAVLMDAPPPENVAAYVVVADVLRSFGLSTPQVYAADPAQGFALIEDFGDDRYTRLLAGGADEAALYGLAIDTLIALHRAVTEAGALPDLPPYDEARLLAEAALLVDWYAPAALGRSLPEIVRADYLARWRAALPLAAMPAPTVVLRDYHVDNLMLLSGRAGIAACGLLDFQDALIGPASYDVAALLRDARRDVSSALHAAMTERYLAAFPRLDAGRFARSATILAAQRNAKIIGLFVRLWRRDGKPAYLSHLPRVWRLLEDDLQSEPALRPVADWLDTHLPPPRRVDFARRSAA
jgi:N-acetylmuramate 1-kinase